MEIVVDKCHESCVSAGILLIDILGKYHPTLKNSLTSAAQFRLNVESSGDDLIALWMHLGLSRGRSIFTDCGLFDVAADVGQALRNALPMIGKRRVFSRGKKKKNKTFQVQL